SIWQVLSRHPRARCMNRRVLVLLAAMLTLGLALTWMRTRDPTGQLTALAAIKDLNGEIETNETRPGRPVVGVRLRNSLWVADDALAHLERLTTLERLSAQGHFTDAGLAPLRNLKGLKALSISQVTISDTGLGHLKDLTSLETLQLAGIPSETAESQVLQTGEGFAHLRGLVKLQHLSLS